jgi:hypothetical protein
MRMGILTKDKSAGWVEMGRGFIFEQMAIRYRVISKMACSFPKNFDIFNTLFCLLRRALRCR